MHNLVKTLIFTCAVGFLLVDYSLGFSFDGKTVPCKGVNVTGYPKMKEQFLRCNKTTYEGYNTRGETPEGYGPLLCTALCGFVEDKLVDTKTGKLLKDGLKAYDDMFNNIPELVRKDIKKVFDDCFDTNADETVYDTAKPSNCMGIAGVAICIKVGIDGVCNPDTSANENADE